MRLTWPVKIYNHEDLFAPGGPPRSDTGTGHDSDGGDDRVQIQTAP